MIDLDQIDEQLESFRRKAILHSEIPPARRSARHPAEDVPDEPPSPRPSHFRRHTAPVAHRAPEPAPEHKAPPEPEREWRVPPEPVVQPAGHRADPVRPAPPPPVIEEVSPPAPRSIRRRRQVVLDSGMARLVADLVGHRSGSATVTSELISNLVPEVVPEPVSLVSEPMPPLRIDPLPTATPDSAPAPKRARSYRPPIQAAENAKPVAPRPVRIPVEDESEEAWVARARLELAAPLREAATPTDVAEGDERESELHALLDHCREQAYRHDDLQWRAALTLLLARTGRLVEARVEHEATSSRFRTVGTPPGSWIDVGRSLAEAEAVIAGGDGSSRTETPQVRPTRPSLSRDAIRQRVRDKAAALQPHARPAGPKGWTSWEKTG